MTVEARNIRRGRLDALIIRMNKTLDRWNTNYVSRRQLLELDDIQLTDIGVDRVDAEREARKPFWRN